MKTASEKRLKILYYSVNLSFLGVVVIMNIFGIVVGIEEFIKYLHHQIDFNWCINLFFLVALIISIYLLVKVFRTKQRDKRCILSYFGFGFLVIYEIFLLITFIYAIGMAFNAFDCHQNLCILCGIK